MRAWPICARCTSSLQSIARTGRRAPPAHIDAALIEAERQVRNLLTEANKLPSAPDAVKQVWVVIDRMAATPAKTLAGAACKLSIVLDPEVGLAAGESGKEIPMLLDVLTVVERLADSTALPEDR